MSSTTWIFCAIWRMAATVSSTALPPSSARTLTSLADWAVVWALCAAGWMLAIASTFAVDHLELTGLRQAGWAAPRDDISDALQVGGLHAWVRHPLMTGLLVAFWATPDMGASHLLFALASSGYIAVGVMFEERDLRRTFGESYEAYAARVPALFPKFRIGRRRTGSSLITGA